jgi:RNA recognition motif-containing protein
LSDHPASSPSAVTTTNSSSGRSTSKEPKQLLTNASATTTTTQSPALLSTTEPPYKSKLIVNNHHHHHHHHSNSKSIKSRSGSESPISNRSSRSPSSCSSTHSSHITTPTSSRDSNASPIAGDLLSTAAGHNTPSSHHHAHHRHTKSGSGSASKSLSGSSHGQRHRRNLQTSLASVPLQSASATTTVVDKPASTSSLSSTGSFSGSNSLGFYSEDNRPLAICVRNLPLRSSDTSLKDGLFHEYKKHGKVTWVKVVGQNHDRYALVCFKKPEDVDKALEVSQDKLFFGCKIEVQSYQGYDVDDNEFRPYEAELDEYQPKSTRTLFIGNLEKDITVTELRKHFECFGEILEIDIKKQGSTPYAFCQYADIVSVVKAVRKMDGEHLGSTRIKLGFGKSMPTTCVWFDGIAESVTEHYLSQQCSRYGVVQKVTIDHERKMALATFEQIQSAQQAVKEMRGIPMRGRKLQVDFASRECIDAFYGRLDAKNANSTATVITATVGSANYELPATTNNTAAPPASAAVSATGGRYLSSLSRSRASSFSRPANHLSGTASPTSTPSAGSTPRHLSNASNVSRKFRYAAGSPEFYDSNEYLDSYTNFDQERAVDSDHLNANEGELLSATATRRRCDKSPGKKEE